MNRDDIELLRRANPVPEAVGYPDHEIAQRVADVLDPDRVLITTTPVARPVRLGRTRGRLVPALAAAVVLVLAVLSAVLVSRGHGSGGNAAGPGSSPVTCAVSTAGGAQATRAREAIAVQVISTRLNALGGSSRAFSYDSTGGTVGFTAHGVARATAVQACRASTASIRPLVTRPVAVDIAAQSSANPLSSLTFPVPADETAYGRLTSAEQAQLASAMAHFDCSTAATGSGTLMCSDATGTEQVFLLGKQIAGGADIATAGAVAPSTASGVQWIVSLTLRDDAAARLTDFTAQHHTASTTADLSRCGVAGDYPCEDFLALSADGVVVSAPLIESTISGAIQVGADLTKDSAHALAADYTAAAIGIRPS